MPCRKCGVRTVVPALPSVSLPEQAVSEADTKYAVVQFRQQFQVNYGAISRKFETTEVISMPYPLIKILYDMVNSPIIFRTPQQELAFRVYYGYPS